jgi:hypothetical protein
MIIVAGLAAAAVAAAMPAIGQLERFSEKDTATALKSALEKGSREAVASLGRPDGFLGNAAVKIPLPPSVARAEGLMRRVGMGKYADELVVTLNRAAEAAVPEAQKILVDSVKKMSVQDAKGILTGGETSATDYFKRTTQSQLRDRFLPIVQKSTAKVGLAQKYNQYAEQGAAFGLVKKEDANLDDYVTQKALDGLYVMIAEEEKKIRKDPVRAGTEIVKRVFGAL